MFISAARRVTFLLATAFMSALAVAACGGTVVFEEDGGAGDGGGVGNGGNDGNGANGATTAAQTSVSSTSGTPGPTSTTGASTSVSSTNVSAVSSTGSGPECPFTNDGVCDEPDVCPPGTDVADCATPSTPCGAECAGDPGCDFRPPNPGPACRTCVEDLAPTFDACAVEALLSDTCQSFVECAEYVNCILAGGIECEEDYPEGANLASSLLYASCGSCGDGNPG